MKKYLGSGEKYEKLQYPGNNLRGSDWRDSEFKIANFQGASLHKAKFIRSIFFKEIDFKKAKLNGADFSNANILEADFTNADLRRANFSGAKLGKVNFTNAQLEKSDFTDAEVLPDHKVDFSNANIKGANFTSAKFNKVKFYRVKAGIKNFHLLFFVVPSFIVFCALSAFTTAITLSLSRYYFHSRRNSISSEIIIWLISVLLITSLRYYLAVLNVSFFTISLPSIHLLVAISLIIIAEYSVFLIVWLNELKADIKSLLFTTIVLISYIFIVLHSKEIGEFIHKILFGLLPNNMGGGVVGAGIGAGLGCYFFRRVLKKDESFHWLWKIYVLFVSNGGTIFYETDLTDADFQDASLQGANFRNAIITRTRWYRAKDLQFARLGNSYLKFPEVHQLVVDQKFIKRENKENIFEGGDFPGLNLECAELSGINFIGTNLNQANLRNAILTFARLKGTKLDGADLTDATLTGAYIESLNYNESTIFKGVKCDYVLIKYIDSIQGYERLPRTKNFKIGDFEKLFNKDKNVIQLFIRREDNREALASAFQSLMEDKHYLFKGFEVVGDDALVKIKIPDDTDKDMVENAFYQSYKAKVEEIRTNQPDNQSQKVGDEVLHFVNYIGNIYMTQHDSSKNITVGKDLNSLGTFNLGEIKGDVTNTINQLPVSPEPENPGIKELLTQLQTAIEAEDNLTPKNKEKALKQVKALAEASQNPNNEEKQDLADTAITMLKGLISGLPTAATLVETCNQLFPMISKYLGIG